MFILFFINVFLYNLFLTFFKLFCWWWRQGPFHNIWIKHLPINSLTGQGKRLYVNHLSVICLTTICLTSIFITTFCLTAIFTVWCTSTMRWRLRVVGKWWRRIIMRWRNVSEWRFVNNRKWWRSRNDRMRWGRYTLLMMALWSSEHLIGNEYLPWNAFLL